MASSPPTMTCSVPRWAPCGPPLTGASSTWMPRSARTPWIRRIRVGELVDRAVRPAGALLDEAVGGSAAHVVDDEGVPRLHKVRGHRPAHGAQSDESDAHSSLPSSRMIWSRGT